MIWEILPLVLIFLGFGGALVFLVKKSGVITDEEVNKTFESIRLVRFLKSFYREKIKSRLQSKQIEEKTLLFFEKVLRWMKILTSRFENFLTGQIEAIKELRARPETDPLYWLQVRRDALERRIEELLAKPKSARFDPLKEELKLIKNNNDSVEEWLRIAKFYLDSGNLTEARRLIVRSWSVKRGDEKTRLLIERFDLRIEEDKLSREAGSRRAGNSEKE